MGEVAELVFDLAEGFVVGEIDEEFGHASEDVFGVGAKLLEEGLDAGLAIVGGGQGGRGRGVRHGTVLVLHRRLRFGFPTTTPNYHGGPIFPPTFVEHTRGQRVCVTLIGRTHTD